MIPKKIRRTIIVNDVEYEYCITGWKLLKRMINGHSNVRVFIKNLTTNATINKYYDYECSLGPADIRKIILDTGV